MINKTLIILLGFSLLSSCSPVYQLLNISPSGKLKEISYTQESQNKLFEFYYPDTLGNEYLRKLRKEYKLDLLVEDKTSEYDKIKAICGWTNKQWEHNGSNSPSKQDALTILKEAHEGKMFRCVEYGIVAAAALNSIGVPARPLSLKTRDVEKVMRGAGHVVAEAYSKEYDKWIFIDPQFNIVPTLNGIPLNGVEFQKEIFNKNPGLKLINDQGELSKDLAAGYIKWIGKYLFYFDILFDQKTLEGSKFKTIEGKTKITLVPLGYKEPRVFQRNNKIDYSHYTNSLNDFYRKPY